MQKYEYNVTKNLDYIHTALKVIVFGVDPNEKFYVCYIMPNNKIVIFEWYHQISAEIVDIEPIEFLIKKIMRGYEMIEVPKTRSGFTFLKDKIFVKYRNLLRVHYGQGIYLDENFQLFLKSSLYDSEVLLRKSMKKINDYMELPF